MNGAIALLVNAMKMLNTSKIRMIGVSHHRLLCTKKSTNSRITFGARFCAAVSKSEFAASASGELELAESFPSDEIDSLIAFEPNGDLGVSGTDCNQLILFEVAHFFGGLGSRLPESFYLRANLRSIESTPNQTDWRDQ